MSETPDIRFILEEDGTETQVEYWGWPSSPGSEPVEEGFWSDEDEDDRDDD